MMLVFSIMIFRNGIWRAWKHFKTRSVWQLLSINLFAGILAPGQTPMRCSTVPPADALIVDVEVLRIKVYFVESAAVDIHYRLSLRQSNFWLLVSNLWARETPNSERAVCNKHPCLGPRGGACFIFLRKIARGPWVMKNLRISGSVACGGIQGPCPLPRKLALRDDGPH